MRKKIPGLSFFPKPRGKLYRFGLTDLSCVVDNVARAIQVSGVGQHELWKKLIHHHEYGGINYVDGVVFMNEEQDFKVAVVPESLDKEYSSGLGKAGSSQKEVLRRMESEPGNFPGVNACKSIYLSLLGQLDSRFHVLDTSVKTGKIDSKPRDETWTAYLLVMIMINYKGDKYTLRLVHRYNHFKM